MILIAIIFFMIVIAIIFLMIVIAVIFMMIFVMTHDYSSIIINIHNTYHTRMEFIEVFLE